MSSASPRQFVDPDGRIKQATRLGQPLRIGERDPGDRHRGAMRLHALGEILRVAGRDDEAAAAVSDALGLYEAKGNVAAAGKARPLIAEMLER